MGSRTWKALLCIGVLCLAAVMSGCAGRVFAPKNQVWYYHQELPAADRAVDICFAHADPLGEQFRALAAMLLLPPRTAPELMATVGLAKLQPVLITSLPAVTTVFPV